MLLQRKFLISLCAIVLIGSSNLGHTDALQDAINSPHRSDENRARDTWRHPSETLRYFEVEEHMSVIEIWPGRGGWYTEILAPYLRDRGTLYLADFSDDMASGYVDASRKALREKLAKSPEVYDKAIFIGFNPGNDEALLEGKQVDRILTFRNAHNWYMYGGGEKNLEAAFAKLFAALKPGGILGVVDHRLPEKADDSAQENSGYIKQSTVIAAAEKAGFELAGSSEINANPKDTADYPEGVWTLPPSLRLKDQDRERYMAIGESDRMTLKFVKPE